MLDIFAWLTSKGIRAATLLTTTNHRHTTRTRRLANATGSEVGFELVMDGIQLYASVFANLAMPAQTMNKSIHYIHKYMIRISR